MRCPISSSISPLPGMIGCMYLNFSIFDIIVSQMVMFQIESKYSIFVLLSLNPSDSKVLLYFSNLVLTPSLVSSTKTISSTNNIYNNTSSWTSFMSSSIRIVKRKGLKVTPWCNLISINKSSVSSNHHQPCPSLLIHIFNSLNVIKRHFFFFSTQL